MKKIISKISVLLFATIIFWTIYSVTYNILNIIIDEDYQWAVNGISSIFTLIMSLVIGIALITRIEKDGE